MEFLTSQNQQFIYKNAPIQLRGVGLGNWLTLEHFMFGLPGTESQIRQMFNEAYGKKKANEFWNKYYSVYIHEADIKFVHDCGMNHVRIPINYRLFFTDDFEKSVAIREVDRILTYLKKYNVWGVIDLHAAPVGQNPDWHSDNHSGKDEFWSNQDAMDQMVNLWSKIAKYYEDEPAIGGYDLINEPCYFTKEAETTMVKFFRDCTDAIRKVDNNHLIFYSGNTYSRDFSMFLENLDDNSSYTFHLYPFLQISEEMKSSNIREKIKESLYRDVSYKHLTETLKKPLWCGETGHPLYLSDSYHVLYEFISILENRQIGWALWPLKDCGEMAMTYSNKTGTWKKLCSKISNNWIFWNTFTKDSMISAEQEDDKYNYYKWLASESTDAWEISRKNLKEISFEELMTALDDFKFENCQVNKKLIPNKEWYL